MTKKLPQIPEYKLDIVLSGILSALMTFFILYSANPARTPVYLQCIFQNIPVIPSSIMRKFLIKKMLFINGNISFQVYFVS